MRILILTILALGLVAVVATADEEAMEAHMIYLKESAIDVYTGDRSIPADLASSLTRGESQM